MGSYKTWEKLLSILNQEYGIQKDLMSVLFLVGIQESGMGFKGFSQEEKTELIKLAEFTLLSRENFYKKIGQDLDHWPIWAENPMKNLPAGQILNTLLKSLVLEYFNELHTKINV